MTTPNKPNNSSGVTDDQYTLLSAIDAFFLQHGCSPTWTEISMLTGNGRSTMRDQALKLVQAGYLMRGPGAHRNLSVTPAGRRAIHLHRQSADALAIVA